MDRIYRKLSNFANHPASSAIMALVFIVILTIAGVFTKVYNNKHDREMMELNSQISEYKQQISWLQKELEDYKNKPLDQYSVSELLEIEEVKRFDEQYRRELDADEKLGEYIIVDTKDLTEAFLTHRADNPNAPVVIERAFGIVTTDELDGRIIDTADNGDYISYRKVKNAQKGDFIVTYMLYENNNYTDTIEVREDFILDISEGR